MNPDILAGIVKNFYNSFNMKTFENRLKIQKIIYLMQAYGLNIGYTYGLYLYGPYSTELTRDAFSMPDFTCIKKIAFSNKEDQKKFNSFIRFMGDRKEDPLWLEIAASVHLLRKNYGFSHNKIIYFIKRKHNNSLQDKEGLIKEIFTELRMEGILDGS